MDSNSLMEQLKYSSSECLYVVTWNNVLKQVFCPFKVSVLSNVGDLFIGQIVLVEQVKVTMDLITVFVIEDVAYYYYHFHIELE